MKKNPPTHLYGENSDDSFDEYDEGCNSPIFACIRVAGEAYGIDVVQDDDEEEESGEDVVILPTIHKSEAPTLHEIDEQSYGSLISEQSFRDYIAEKTQNGDTESDAFSSLSGSSGRLSFVEKSSLVLLCDGGADRDNVGGCHPPLEKIVMRISGNSSEDASMQKEEHSKHKYLVANRLRQTDLRLVESRSQNSGGRRIPRKNVSSSGDKRDGASSSLSSTSKAAPGSPNSNNKRAFFLFRKRETSKKGKKAPGIFLSFRKEPKKAAPATRSKKLPNNSSIAREKVKKDRYVALVKEIVVKSNRRG
jgi:hypothetical protein